MSTAEHVVSAARALVAEVDRRHDQEKAPRRYMTPYGEVTRLRLALVAHDKATRAIITESPPKEAPNPWQSRPQTAFRRRSRAS